MDSLGLTCLESFAFREIIFPTLCSLVASSCGGLWGRGVRVGGAGAQQAGTVTLQASRVKPGFGVDGPPAAGQTGPARWLRRHFP